MAVCSIQDFLNVGGKWIISLSCFYQFAQAGRLFYSEDIRGGVWNEVTSGFPNKPGYIYDIKYGHGKFVVVTSPMYLDNGQLIYSTDLLTWNPSININGVSSCKLNFIGENETGIFAYNCPPHLYLSSDGVNYNFSEEDSIYSSAYLDKDKQFVLTTLDGGYRLSPDGMNWGVEKKIISGTPFTWIVQGDGYVAVSDLDNSIYLSNEV